jgi:hypothetical protein
MAQVVKGGGGGEEEEDEEEEIRPRIHTVDIPVFRHVVMDFADHCIDLECCGPNVICGIFVIFAIFIFQRFVDVLMDWIIPQSPSYIAVLWTTFVLLIVVVVGICLRYLLREWKRVYLQPDPRHHPSHGTLNSNNCDLVTTH